MTTFDPPSNAEANQTSHSVDLGASKVNALANAELRDMLSELCWLAQAYEAKEFGGDELEDAIDDRTKKITELFQARERQFLADIKAGKIPYFEGVVIPERQQQLLTEILGELPKKESTEGLPPDHEAIYDRGFNKCRQQVVSVIERYREGL